MDEFEWRQEPKAVSAAEKVISQSARMRKSFGNHVNIIALIVVILLQVFLPFVNARFQNPFTAQFIFYTACNIASTLLAYYLLVPDGKRDRSRLQEFADATKAWKNSSALLKSQNLLTAFRAYCEGYGRKEAEAIYDERIEALENAGISAADYETKYRKHRHLFYIYFFKGEISKEQYKLIKVCRKRIKVEPVSTNFVLSGGNGKKSNDSIRHDSSYERRAMATKPFTVILFVLVPSFIELFYNPSVNAVVVITNIVVRGFCVCWSALAGYRTGVKIIQYREVDILNRVEFIDEFIEQSKNKVIE